jgi:hypothetical protein
LQKETFRIQSGEVSTHVGPPLSFLFLLTSLTSHLSLSLSPTHLYSSPLVLFCSDRFHDQFVKCRKVQALFRGYQTRTHWDRTYLRIKEANEIYQKCLEKAAKMRFFLLKKLFRQQFKTWSHHAKALRALKQSCCLRIQVNYRGYRARSLYHSLHKRCVQANRKYLIACELHHSFTLVQLLRTWNGIWFNTRNKRCAHLLIVFLSTSSWQVKLKRAGVKLHKLLMIKRKYSNRRSFQR